MSVAATDDGKLATLDQIALTPIVRTVLNDHTAEIVRWRSAPIIQGRASPAGVHRISGIAQVQDDAVPWSLVLKELHAAAQSAYAGNHASDDPTSAWYWKRELLLYQSGLFDALPAGFAAPHPYQIDEQPLAGRIWMEDVREDVGAVWPLDHYGHVARHLGRFNGIYLAERSLPPWPWLLTRYLHSGLQKSEWPAFAAHYPALRQTSSLVRRGWSDDLFAAFARIWQERAWFLQILEALPQTLMHNDAGRKNLIARRRPNGDFETVVVDWGQAAIGALGEELAVLVSQPVYWLHGVRPEDLAELDTIVFNTYVQGLRDVGWQGDPALARLGYTVSLALRSGFGIFIFEWAARDENTRTFIETAIGHPIEATVDAMRGLRSYIVACAEEARHLMAAPRVQRYL